MEFKLDMTVRYNHGPYHDHVALSEMMDVFPTSAKFK